MQFDFMELLNQMMIATAAKENKLMGEFLSIFYRHNIPPFETTAILLEIAQAINKEEKGE